MAYCDQRLDGVERWYLYTPKDARMRISDELRSSVCFLCAKPTGAGKMSVPHYAGTGFFVGIAAKDPRLAGGGFIYLVTARHVVQRAIEGLEDMQIRLNLKQGGVIHPDLSRNWLVPNDDAVDVAAVHVQLPHQPPILYSTIAEPVLATDDFIQENGVGMGDDVFTIGLFTSHHHGERNEPIMRSGIIAAMPGESWVDQSSGLPYQAYLMESRSTGGLSGSPVFVYVDHGPDVTEISDTVRIKVIGVVRSKWEYAMGPSAESDLHFTHEQIEDINLGMTQVTPIQEVLKLLNAPNEVKLRAATERKWLKRELVQASDAATPEQQRDA